MKQVSILLLSYLLLLLITISCKENFEIQSQEISISEAKNWFENYSKSNQPAINNNSQNSQEGTTASIVKQIYWDKAKRLKKDKGLPEGFAIPIWYEAKYRFGKQSIRELWISKDDKGEMKAQVIEILGTDEYFNANGNKLDMTNFTGGITMHDWKDGFQGGLFYKNGIRVGYINEYTVTTNIQPALKKIDNNQRVSDCGYQYSYVTNGELYIVWVYQLCMSDWWMLYYNNPYHAQAWIDSQYGCEVTSTCVGDTNPPPYYEPEPEPTWAGKDLGYPDMWWLDETWLDDNFKTDPYDQFKKLTKVEKDLVKQYPQEALNVKENAEIATQKTISQYGVNGLNDKSDAFRHAYFQGLNTYSIGSSLTKLFSDAHESEVPTKFKLEKEMDLFNNAAGIRYGSNCPCDSELLVYYIIEGIARGELRYLYPINYSDPCFGGCSASPEGTHGITNTTALTPTNF